MSSQTLYPFSQIVSAPATKSLTKSGVHSDFNGSHGGTFRLIYLQTRQVRNLRKKRACLVIAVEFSSFWMYLFTIMFFRTSHGRSSSSSSIRSRRHWQCGVEKRIGSICSWTCSVFWCIIVALQPDFYIQCFFRNSQYDKRTGLLQMNTVISRTSGSLWSCGSSNHRKG